MAAIDTLDLDARNVLLSTMTRMAGADGQLSDVEAAALRGAAIALGRLGPVIEPVRLGRLSERERMLVFTGTAWVMLADGIRARGESRYLAWLADRLGLSRETARFLVAHATWVRTETELPWHREFDWLLTEAAKRIGLVEARRAA